MANGWKVLAICLIVLQVLEIGFIVLSLNIYQEDEDGRVSCMEYCGTETPFYFYEKSDKFCSCYNAEKEVVKSKFIKG